jgi:hypothetical protein
MDVVVDAHQFAQFSELMIFPHIILQNCLGLSFVGLLVHSKNTHGFLG